MASLLSDEDIDCGLGAVTVAYIAAELEKPKRRRKTWVKKWLKKIN